MMPESRLQKTRDAYAAVEALPENIQRAAAVGMQLFHRLGDDWFEKREREFIKWLMGDASRQ